MFRTNIANRLGLDNSVSGDQTYIDGWVNDGVIQTLLDTHCYVTSTTVTPGATSDYTLTSSVLEIVYMSATSAGITYQLERLTVPELLEVRRNASASTAPTQYYALAGQNTVLFHPTPGSADTYTLYYVPVPTALSAGSDDPSNASNGGIPTAYHKAIEYFALSEAADANDDASSQMGAKYFQLYQDQVRKIRRHLRARGGDRLPRVRPVGGKGYRGHYPNHDNSVYPSYRP
jgi:hypothetical protein